MKEKFFRWIVILLIAAIAFGNRSFASQRLPIGIDEPVYLNSSLAYARFLRNMDWKDVAWYDQNSEHPALAKLVYGFALLPITPIDSIQHKDMVNDSPIQESEAKDWILWVRSISVMLGTISCVFLATINPAAGLLMAIQTSAVRYTSLIGLESLPLLSSLLSVLAYEQWINQQEYKPINKNWGWLALSSIMLGLTAAAKYVYCIAGIAVLIHLILHAYQKRWSARSALIIILLWGTVAFVTFFVTNPYLWPNPINRLIFSATYHFNFAASEHVTRYQYPFWQFLVYIISRSGNQSWYWISIDAPIFLLALLGLYRLRKRPLYMIWLASALLFLMTWQTRWEQYVLIMMAPYCLSAGEGLAFLREQLKTRVKRSKL